MSFSPGSSAADILVPFLEIAVLWLLVLVARYGPGVCTGLEPDDAIPGILTRLTISVGWIASLLAWAILIGLGVACFLQFILLGAGFVLIFCVGTGWLFVLCVAVPVCTVWRQRRPIEFQTTRQASSPIA